MIYSNNCERNFFFIKKEAFDFLLALCATVIFAGKREV
jgi:hypothetical protein